MSRIPEVDRKFHTFPKPPSVRAQAGEDETGNVEYRSPLLCLQIELTGMPLPAWTSTEIHRALQDLARFDRGETRELFGLAAWLDFLRAPYAEEVPMDAADIMGPEDIELSRVIGAALDHVVANPTEAPEDSLQAMDRLLSMRPKEYCAPIFDPDAVPPFERFQALCGRERNFKDALSHKGTALPFSDYEAILAEYALADGWSEQEVFDLLTYNRKKWLESPIPDTGVIDAARAFAGGASRPATEPAEPTATAVDLSPAIAILRRALGLPVARVRKLGRKRGVFELVLEGGATVDLGTASALLSHREVQAAVMDATGRTIPLLRGEIWRKTVDAVLSAAVVEETDNAPEEETLYWLRTAKANCASITLDRDAPLEMAKILRDGVNQPVYLGRGEMFVCLPALIRYVHVTAGVRVTWPDMSLRLRKVGFRPEQVGARDHSGVAKSRLWVSPRGFSAE